MTVVILITGILLTIFASNLHPAGLGSGPNYRHQLSSIVLSSLRRAQQKTLAGTLVNGNFICGYGLHYVDTTSYLIYAGGVPGGSNCGNGSRNYQSGRDLLVETVILSNKNFDLAGSNNQNQFDDIFFEVPDAKTYIKNSSNLTPTIDTTQIRIVSKGQTCNTSPSNSNCTTIDVFASGLIDVKN